MSSLRSVQDFGYVAQAIRRVLDKHPDGFLVIKREQLWLQLLMYEPRLKACSSNVRRYFTLAFGRVGIGCIPHSEQGKVMVYDKDRCAVGVVRSTNDGIVIAQV